MRWGSTAEGWPPRLGLPTGHQLILVQASPCSQFPPLFGVRGAGQVLGNTGRGLRGGPLSGARSSTDRALSAHFRRQLGFWASTAHEVRVHFLCQLGEATVPSLDQTSVRMSQ